MGVLSRLGNYISTEQGFRRASLVGFGVPSALVGGLIFNDYGGIVWLLVVPGAAFAAYIWSAIMWKLMFRELYAQRRAALEKDRSHGSR
jgi:hypothetical protein